MDGEVIGKKFNTGQGMGVEVPVELRFTGNQKYLTYLKKTIMKAARSELQKKEE